MMTVSAVARLIPRPPARVDSRKQNAGDPTATEHHVSNTELFKSKGKGKSKTH